MKTWKLLQLASVIFLSLWLISGVSAEENDPEILFQGDGFEVREVENNTGWRNITFTENPPAQGETINIPTNQSNYGLDPDSEQSYTVPRRILDFQHRLDVGNNFDITGMEYGGTSDLRRKGSEDFFQWEVPDVEPGDEYRLALGLRAGVEQDSTEEFEVEIDEDHNQLDGKPDRNLLEIQGQLVPFEERVFPSSPGQNTIPQSVAVDDDYVYIGTDPEGSGDQPQIRKTNKFGEEECVFDYNGQGVSALDIDPSGNIYFVSADTDNPEVVRLNAECGEDGEWTDEDIEWSNMDLSGLSTDIEYLNNQIYVVGEDNNVLEIDAEDGTTLEMFEAEDTGEFRSLTAFEEAGEERVFVGTANLDDGLLFSSDGVVIEIMDWESGGYDVIYDSGEGDDIQHLDHGPEKEALYLAHEGGNIVRFPPNNDDDGEFDGFYDKGELIENLNVDDDNQIYSGGENGLLTRLDGGEMDAGGDEVDSIYEEQVGDLGLTGVGIDSEGFIYVGDEVEEIHKIIKRASEGAEIEINENGSEPLPSPLENETVFNDITDDVVSGLNNATLSTVEAGVIDFSFEYNTEPPTFFEENVLQQVASESDSRDFSVDITDIGEEDSNLVSGMKNLVDGSSDSENDLDMNADTEESSGLTDDIGSIPEIDLDQVKKIELLEKITEDFRIVTEVDRSVYLMDRALENPEILTDEQIVLNIREDQNTGLLMNLEALEQAVLDYSIEEEVVVRSDRESLADIREEESQVVELADFVSLAGEHRFEKGENIIVEDISEETLNLLDTQTENVETAIQEDSELELFEGKETLFLTSPDSETDLNIRDSGTETVETGLINNALGQFFATNPIGPETSTLTESTLDLTDELLVESAAVTNSIVFVEYFDEFVTPVLADATGLELFNAQFSELLVLQTGLETENLLDAQQDIEQNLLLAELIDSQAFLFSEGAETVEVANEMDEELDITENNFVNALVSTGQEESLMLVDTSFLQILTSSQTFSEIEVFSEEFQEVEVGAEEDPQLLLFEEEFVQAQILESSEELILLDSRQNQVLEIDRSISATLDMEEVADQNTLIGVNEDGSLEALDAEQLQVDVESDSEEIFEGVFDQYEKIVLALDLDENFRLESLETESFETGLEMDNLAVVSEEESLQIFAQAESEELSELQEILEETSFIQQETDSTLDVQQILEQQTVLLDSTEVMIEAFEVNQQTSEIHSDSFDSVTFFQRTLQNLVLDEEAVSEAELNQALDEDLIISEEETAAFELFSDQFETVLTFQDQETTVSAIDTQELMPEIGLNQEELLVLFSSESTSTVVNTEGLSETELEETFKQSASILAVEDDQANLISEEDALALIQQNQEVLADLDFSEDVDLILLEESFSNTDLEEFQREDVQTVSEFEIFIAPIGEQEINILTQTDSENLAELEQLLGEELETNLERDSTAETLARQIQDSVAASTITGMFSGEQSVEQDTDIGLIQEELAGLAETESLSIDLSLESEVLLDAAADLDGVTVIRSESQDSIESLFDETLSPQIFTDSEESAVIFDSEVLGLDIATDQEDVLILFSEQKISSVINTENIDSVDIQQLLTQSSGLMVVEDESLNSVEQRDLELVLTEEQKDLTELGYSRDARIVVAQNSIEELELETLERQDLKAATDFNSLILPFEEKEIKMLTQSESENLVNIIDIVAEDIEPETEGTTRFNLINQQIQSIANLDAVTGMFYGFQTSEEGIEIAERQLELGEIDHVEVLRAETGLETAPVLELIDEETSLLRIDSEVDSKLEGLFETETLSEIFVNQEDTALFFDSEALITEVGLGQEEVLFMFSEESSSAIFQLDQMDSGDLEELTTESVNIIVVEDEEVNILSVEELSAEIDSESFNIANLGFSEDARIVAVANSVDSIDTDAIERQQVTVSDDFETFLVALEDGEVAVVTREDSQELAELQQQLDLDPETEIRQETTLETISNQLQGFDALNSMTGLFSGTQSIEEGLDTETETEFGVTVTEDQILTIETGLDIIELLDLTETQSQMLMFESSGNVALEALFDVNTEIQVVSEQEDSIVFVDTQSVLPEIDLQQDEVTLVFGEDQASISVDADMFERADIRDVIGEEAVIAVFEDEEIEFLSVEELETVLQDEQVDLAELGFSEDARISVFQESVSGLEVESIEQENVLAVNEFETLFLGFENEDAVVLTGAESENLAEIEEIIQQDTEINSIADSQLVLFDQARENPDILTRFTGRFSGSTTQTQNIEAGISQAERVNLSDIESLSISTDTTLQDSIDALNSAEQITGVDLDIREQINLFSETELAPYTVTDQQDNTYIFSIEQLAPEIIDEQAEIVVTSSETEEVLMIETREDSLISVEDIQELGLEIKKVEKESLELESLQEQPFAVEQDGQVFLDLEKLQEEGFVLAGVVESQGMIEQTLNNDFEVVSQEDVEIEVLEDMDQQIIVSEHSDALTTLKQSLSEIPFLETDEENNIGYVEDNSLTALIMYDFWVGDQATVGLNPEIGVEEDRVFHADELVEQAFNSDISAMETLNILDQNNEQFTLDAEAQSLIFTELAASTDYAVVSDTGGEFVFIEKNDVASLLNSRAESGLHFRGDLEETILMDQTRAEELNLEHTEIGDVRVTDEAQEDVLFARSVSETFTGIFTVESDTGIESSGEITLVAIDNTEEVLNLQDNGHLNLYLVGGSDLKLDIFGEEDFSVISGQETRTRSEFVDQESLTGLFTASSTNILASSDSALSTPTAVLNEEIFTSYRDEFLEEMGLQDRGELEADFEQVQNLKVLTREEVDDVFQVINTVEEITDISTDQATDIELLIDNQVKPVAFTDVDDNTYYVSQEKLESIVQTESTNVVVFNRGANEVVGLESDAISEISLETVQELGFDLVMLESSSLNIQEGGDIDFEVFTDTDGNIDLENLAEQGLVIQGEVDSLSQFQEALDQESGIKALENSELVALEDSNIGVVVEEDGDPVAELKRIVSDSVLFDSKADEVVGFSESVTETAVLFFDNFIGDRVAVGLSPEVGTETEKSVNWNEIVEETAQTSVDVEEIIIFSSEIGEDIRLDSERKSIFNSMLEASTTFDAVGQVDGNITYVDTVELIQRLDIEVDSIKAVNIGRSTIIVGESNAVGDLDIQESENTTLQADLNIQREQNFFDSAAQMISGLFSASSSTELEGRVSENLTVVDISNLEIDLEELQDEGVEIVGDEEFQIVRVEDTGINIVTGLETVEQASLIDSQTLTGAVTTTGTSILTSGQPVFSGLPVQTNGLGYFATEQFASEDVPVGLEQSRILTRRGLVMEALGLGTESETTLELTADVVEEPEIRQETFSEIILDRGVDIIIDIIPIPDFIEGPFPDETEEEDTDTEDDTDTDEEDTGTGIGGGGGGAIPDDDEDDEEELVLDSDLRIDTDSLTFSLVSGESDSATIEGEVIGDEPVEMTIDLAERDIQELSEYLSVPQLTYTLEPGSFEIPVDVSVPMTADGDIIQPQVIEDEFVFEIEGKSVSIPATLIIRDDDRELLDVSLDLVEHDIRPGSEYPMTIEIFNMGTAATADILLETTVTNDETGEVVYSESEELAVSTSISIVRNTRELEEGRYTIRTVANYDNRTAESSSTITVSEETGAFGLISDYVVEEKDNIVTVVLLAAILLVFIYISYLKGWIRRSTPRKVEDEIIEDIKEMRDQI